MACCWQQWFAVFSFKNNFKTPEDLSKFCDKAKSSPIVSVDTEFFRHGKTSSLSLIQVGIPDENESLKVDIALVDCLSARLHKNGRHQPDPMQALWEIFANPAIVKVFHAAYMDIKLINKNMGSQGGLKNIFDTQIGYAYISTIYNIGYRDLVEIFTGEKIDKTQQNSQWNKRPLNRQQITYAARDVLYLPTLYFSISQKLYGLGHYEIYKDAIHHMLLKDKTQEKANTIRVRFRKFNDKLPLLLEINNYLDEYSQENNIAKVMIANQPELMQLLMGKIPARFVGWRLDLLQSRFSSLTGYTLIIPDEQEALNENFPALCPQNTEEKQEGKENQLPNPNTIWKRPV